MELILLRHGQIPGNLEHRFMGITDQPLSPAGRDQARQTARTLPPVDHVFVSPLSRCTETASLLWPGAETTSLPDLIETDFGPFEGKCHAELKDDPQYQAWLSTFETQSEFPGVESPAHCAARACSAMKELLSRAAAEHFSRVGVVTHGGILLYIVQEFLGREHDFYQFMCNNCGGFRLDCAPDGKTFRITDTYPGF